MPTVRHWTCIYSMFASVGATQTLTLFSTTSFIYVNPSSLHLVSPVIGLILLPHNWTRPFVFIAGLDSSFKVCGRSAYIQHAPLLLQKIVLLMSEPLDHTASCPELDLRCWIILRQYAESASLTVCVRLFCGG